MKKSSLSFLVLGTAAILFCNSNASAQTQLLLNGTFDTSPALSTGTFTQAAGRTGNATAVQILNGTSGATTGWFTNDPDGYFEVWTPGYLGSPTGVGNTLELANNGGGNTIYQDVTSTVGAGASATFSFGYAARDPGTDAFTLTITNLTAGTTVLTQPFNPTAAFSTNTTYSTSFAITAGSRYRVSFLDQNTNPGSKPNSASAHIDSVSFVQVPEPSTTLLLGAGVLGMFLICRSLRSRMAARV